MNKKRKIGITLLVIIFIVIGLGLIVDKVTEFKTDNSKIENIIREQAHKEKGKLRKSDLDKVTKIDSTIGEDEGKYLYLFKNLEELIITGTAEYNNIDFLEDNKKLKKLNIILRDGRVENIDGLKKLENLEELSFGNTDVENIDSISNLINLKKLIIICSNIKDWSGINKLTNLEYLEIEISELNDKGIKALIGDFKKLKILGLSSNNIKDISSLSNLKNLNTLWLDNNKIENISPLKNLSQLKKLRISGNKIENIDSLMEMKDLKELWLYNNIIEDEEKLKILQERIYKNNPDSSQNRFMWKKKS